MVRLRGRPGQDEPRWEPGAGHQTFNISGRLLGLDWAPWNQRFKDDEAKSKAREG